MHRDAYAWGLVEVTLLAGEAADLTDGAGDVATGIVPLGASGRVGEGNANVENNEGEELHDG